MFRWVESSSEAKQKLNPNPPLCDVFFSSWFSCHLVSNIWYLCCEDSRMPTCFGRCDFISRITGIKCHYNEPYTWGLQQRVSICDFKRKETWRWSQHVPIFETSNVKQESGTSRYNMINMILFLEVYQDPKRKHSISNCTQLNSKCTIDSCWSKMVAARGNRVTPTPVLTLQPRNGLEQRRRYETDKIGIHETK